MINTNEYTYGLEYSYIISDALASYTDAIIDALVDAGVYGCSDYVIATVVREACIEVNDFCEKVGYPCNDIIDSVDYNNTDGVDEPDLESVASELVNAIIYA